MVRPMPPMYGRLSWQIVPHLNQEHEIASPHFRQPPYEIQLNQHGSLTPGASHARCLPNLIRLDPFLSSIERARYGPDFPVTIIELDAVKAVIVSAQDDKIPTDAAANAIIDSVDNVPADAKPDDRRYVSATENLKISSVGWASLSGRIRPKLRAARVFAHFGFSVMPIGWPHSVAEKQA